MGKFIFNKVSAILDLSDSEMKVILEYMGEHIRDFQGCLPHGPIEEIRFKAHKIKGELKIIGATELARELEKIEMQILNSNFSDKQTTAFNEGAATLLAEIDAFLHQLNQPGKEKG